MVIDNVRRRSLLQRVGRVGSARPRVPTSVRGDDWFFIGTLAPAIMLLLVLGIYPMIELVRMGMSTVRLENQQFVWQFNLSAHVTRLLNDPIFAAAFRNTIVFVVVSVTLEVLFGLGLALLGAAHSGISRFFNLAAVLPILVMPVAISVGWVLMYNPQFGFFNVLFTSAGLPAQNWLAVRNTAMPAIVAVDVWHWTPFAFLILSVGLTSIPRELYESAAIDGATSLRSFWHITLPFLQSSLAVAAVFRAVVAFKVFDEIFLLTGGGPGTATEVMSVYTQRVFFQGGDYGYGAFLALLMVLLELACVLGYFAVRSVRAAWGRA